MTDLLELARPAGLADVQAGTRAPARVSTGAPGRCGCDRGYHARSTPCLARRDTAR